MANQTIYPRGSKDISVPSSQSIAISNFGGGMAKIFYQVTNANQPPAFQFQQTLENSSVTLGPFSTGKIVRIESGASKIIYDVGASPDTGIGDADTFGGELPSFYRNAANMNSGTLPDARLSANVILTSNIIEGTFTPVLVGISTAGTGTYTTQIGNYQKIGNWVSIRIILVWTAHTGTGNLRITGLPYSGNAAANTYLPVCTSSVTYTGNQIVGLVGTGSALITLFVEAAGSAFASLAMDTAGSIYITGRYLVA